MAKKRKKVSYDYDPLDKRYWHSAYLYPEGRALDPFLDWSFKFIFGREENEDLTRGFIDLILFGKKTIEHLEFLNTEMVPDLPDMKECIFDILCRDSEGNEFLVEMQKRQVQNMNERLLFYASRLITRMGRRGRSWNYRIKKVYTICIMDYAPDGDESVRSDIQLIDKSTGNVFSDKINIVLLKVPNIKANSYEECASSYEKILYLLKQMQGGMNRVNQLMSDIDRSLNIDDYTQAVLDRLLSIANDATLTPEEQDTYDEWQKLAWDNYSAREFEKQQAAAAIDKAVAEGRAEGLAKGRAEGMAQGRAEGEAKALEETARKMKEQGLSAEVIFACTGLDAQAIESL